MSDYDHVTALRNAAQEMRREDQKGWPNVCDGAADEIEQLREVAEMARRYVKDPSWLTHYSNLMRALEALPTKGAAMSGTVKRLRRAAHDSQNHDCPYTQEMLDACAVIERGRREILRLTNGINRIGGMALIKAPHEIIRQNLAELLTETTKDAGDEGVRTFSVYDQYCWEHGENVNGRTGGVWLKSHCPDCNPDSDSAGLTKG